MRFFFTVGFVVFSLFLSSTLEAKQQSNSDKKISRYTVVIPATSEEWVSTKLKVLPGDILLIKASGTISVGGFLGKTGPDGTTSGVGRLKLKIGTEFIESVGSIKYVPVTIAGIAMLRIDDSNYRDNSGEFSVEVIHIPAKLLPRAMPVRAE